LSKPKQKQDKEDDFNKFVSSAIRAPRAGAYEHLLSQFLASAVVVTDPLKRVKIVCEAALMIPESQRNLDISYEKIEVLNIVANALLNKTTMKLPDGSAYVSIPWGFKLVEENFQKFVKPWDKHNLTYYPVLLKKQAEIEWDYRGIPTVKKIFYDPYWRWFFEASGCLTVAGYNNLKNSFAAWAIPQVQLYLAELTRVVSPGLYGQILGLYTRRGKQSYAQKVKEAGEMPKQDESGMGPRI